MATDGRACAAWPGVLVRDPASGCWRRPESACDRCGHGPREVVASEELGCHPEDSQGLPTHRRGGAALGVQQPLGVAHQDRDRHRQDGRIVHRVRRGIPLRTDVAEELGRPLRGR